MAITTPQQGAGIEWEPGSKTREPIGREHRMFQKADWD